MSEAANYSAIDSLRNGHQIEIRSLRADDRAQLLAAIARTSAQSRFRRFFAAKRDFTEQEIEFFLDVDFVNHVALVAVMEENGRPTIVGGARYIIVQAEKAEMAFAVVDQYQGQGIGTVLIFHLATIARAAALKELIAEVLPENVPMLKAFRNSGLPLHTKRETAVVHVVLPLS